MKNFHKNNFFKIGLLNANLINIICNYKNISTAEIDFLLFYYLKILNLKSSTINYNNYKFISCISIDNIICHGIPIFEFIKTKNIKIDFSITNNYHSDCCITINNETYNIFFKKFFYNIIRNIKISFKYSNIGNYINSFNFLKFYNVKEYCSHGIYKKLHNKNIILHNKNNIKKIIKNLDSFTIEPMFYYGNCINYHYKNIYFTKYFSYQWEHTLFIYKKKKIITTIRKSEICIY